MLRARVGMSPAASARARLYRLLQDGSTVAAYRAGFQLTGSSAASAWASYAGTDKYLALPGTSGNYASTPASTANKITGDICIAVLMAATDWTPAVAGEILSRAQSTSNRSYYVTLGTNGRLTFVTSTDGTAGTQVTATSSAAPTVTDGSFIWVLIYRDVDNGAGGNDTKFYTSTDTDKTPENATWTQLGTTQTNAGTTSIFAGTSILELGGVFASAADNVAGRWRRAQIWNGIPAFIGGGASNTPVVDFNAADFAITSTNGATAVASTGETWTLSNTGATPARIETSPTLLQTTGAAQPTINADGSLTFDGSDDKLDAALTLDLSGGGSVYLVLKQITWGENLYILDGKTVNTVMLRQFGASPAILTAAGGSNTGATIGAFHVLSMNTALGFSVDGNTPVNMSFGNMGGYTLGGAGGGFSFHSNIGIKEFIVRTGSDSAATQARIQTYLKQIYGT